MLLCIPLFHYDFFVLDSLSYLLTFVLLFYFDLREGAHCTISCIFLRLGGFRRTDEDSDMDFL